jgi:hypothetical protein
MKFIHWSSRKFNNSFESEEVVKTIKKSPANKNTQQLVIFNKIE